MWTTQGKIAAGAAAGWLGFIGWLNVSSGGWEQEPPPTVEEQLDAACEKAAAAAPGGSLDAGSFRVPAGITAEGRLAGFQEASLRVKQIKDNISKAAALDTAIIEENPQWIAASRDAHRERAAFCHGR